MDRRDTLKAIGIGALFGASANTVSATSGEDDESDDHSENNPGRVGTYNGNKTLAAPNLGGFDKVLLYMREPGPSDDDGEVSGRRFQEDIMGRTMDEIVGDRNAGVEFFEERFGLEFPKADEDTVFDSVSSENDIEATLKPMMLAPSAGYTAYVISGRGMPNNHGDGHTNINPEVTGKVRDGGWWAFLDEASAYSGEYGNEIYDGEFPEGSLVLWGDYNIRMGDQEDPIVIHYDSDHPVPFGRDSPAPMTFNCRVEHAEWGEGAVRGVTGGDMNGNRNVLTFPAQLSDSE